MRFLRVALRPRTWFSVVTFIDNYATRTHTGPPFTEKNV